MRPFAGLSFVAALLAIAVLPACGATMPAVTMKVVDDATGAAMPGVVALFWETAHEGTLTGHGGKSAVLFAVEAVSDQSGELRFPRQDFNSQPFFLNTNYENPVMLLLTPGYAPLELRNQLRIIPTLVEASVWERDGQTVKMKRAGADEIRAQSYMMTFYTNTVAGPDRCLWKRTPQIILTADRMFPDPGQMTTLRFLVMNDALFVSAGCGSPKAFFAPYLAR